MKFSNYARITPLFKSVADPILLHILTSFDISKKNLYSHPKPCIIRFDPNPTKKSRLGYRKCIICSDPFRFHPFISTVERHKRHRLQKQVTGQPVNKTIQRAYLDPKSFRF